MSPYRIASLLALQLAIILALTACIGQTALDDGPLFTPPCIPLDGSEVDPCLRDPLWKMPSQTHGDYSSSAIPTTPIDLFRRMQVLAEYGYDYEGYVTPQFYVRGTFVPGSARCTKSSTWTNSAGSFVSFDCFVDLRVNEYLNGDGPATIPILVYWGSADADESSDYHRAFLRGWPADDLEGKEMVIVLVQPLFRSVGAWGWVRNASWDVQRLKYGKVVVVSLWTGVLGISDSSAWEYTLEEFRPMVKDAMARFRADTGGRVGYHPDDPEFAKDASGASLIEHLRSLGSFDRDRATPAPAPTVEGETRPDPYGYRVDADALAASPEVPGGLEDTPTPQPASDHAPTPTAVPLP